MEDEQGQKRVQAFLERLAVIHARFNSLAAIEMDATITGEPEADGRFWEEKLRLCDETDRILVMLEKGLTSA